MNDADKQFSLKLGISWAKRTLDLCGDNSSNDIHVRKATNEAFALLGPIHAPEHGVPEAPYLLGLLSESLARRELKKLNGQDMEGDQCFAVTYHLKNAEYYLTSTIDRPDAEKNGIRYGAMDALADVLNMGILYERRDVWRKAHFLRVRAADNECPLAIVHLASTYCHGTFGIEPSLPRAQKYVDMAFDAIGDDDTELFEIVDSLQKSIDRRLKGPKTGSDKVLSFQDYRNSHTPRKLLHYAPA